MSDFGAWILLLGRVLIGLNFIAVAGFAHLSKGPMFVGMARQMSFPFPSWHRGPPERGWSLRVHRLCWAYGRISERS
jgi:hypothetical protein